MYLVKVDNQIVPCCNCAYVHLLTRKRRAIDEVYVLLSDGVIIPISHPVTLNIINLNQVKGWHLNALDIHPFKYLHLEKVVPLIPNLVLGK